VKKTADEKTGIKKIKVLVVDDERLARKIIKDFL